MDFDYWIVLSLALAWALTPLLFHEVGHWVVLRRLGVPVAEYWLGLGPMLFKLGRFRVGMLPIGGAVVPEPAPYAKLTAPQKMAVALAGPIASLWYAGIALCVWWVNQELAGAQGLWLVSMLSMVLAGVNLLPIPPLDGYQAYVNWREIQGRPLSALWLNRAERLGSGLVYGVGFWVLGLWVLAR